MRQSREIHQINAVGRQTAHHGDDVWGGSCVGARRNSSTIPTIENLRGGSFLFLPEPLLVKLLSTTPSPLYIAGMQTNHYVFA
jgi:hypothetical protein